MARIFVTDTMGEVIATADTPEDARKVAQEIADKDDTSLWLCVGSPSERPFEQINGPTARRPVIEFPFVSEDSIKFFPTDDPDYQ